ncbi:hypothetical protein AAMO2058_000982900 [Amorphochlora amoebiformis]
MMASVMVTVLFALAHGTSPPRRQFLSISPGNPSGEGNDLVPGGWSKWVSPASKEATAALAATSEQIDGDCKDPSAIQSRTQVVAGINFEIQNNIPR